MKKISKESLKLEKEVITQLTQDHLSQVVGGGILPNTVLTQCICISEGACHTKGPDCTVIYQKTKEGAAMECITKLNTCYPLEPQTEK